MAPLSCPLSLALSLVCDETQPYTHSPKLAPLSFTHFRSLDDSGPPIIFSTNRAHSSLSQGRKTAVTVTTQYSSALLHKKHWEKLLSLGGQAYPISICSNGGKHAVSSSNLRLEAHPEMTLQEHAPASSSLRYSYNDMINRPTGKARQNLGTTCWPTSDSSSSR